jgi:ribosomal protein S18 acetylase RimI-like enzyme
MTTTDTITYRLASVDDVDALAELRWRMETERHPELQADREAYFAVARASIRSEIERGAHIGFLAESGGEVIACAILIWWTMLPSLTDFHRSRGYVSSVYTRPEYRRRGVARTLMENLMTRAREMGMNRLILWASEMGRPLYLDLGFVPSRGLEWNRE